MSGLDFYNDNDPAACAWIEQLIAAGLIPPGRVDNRSIADVRATDLSGLRRAHFFAGIGGWAEALRLADFPDWLPVWTGSPPCQPFSAAGKRAGRDDARHLGPAFVDLVRAGRPPVLFGEQVASSDAIGRAAKPRQQGAGAEPAWAWWDDLSLRLEAAGYAAWAAVVPAAGVGAPHIRERLFFCAVDLRFAAGGVAHSDDTRLEGRREPGRERAAECAAREGGMARGLADADHQRRDRFDALLQRGRQEQAGAEAAGVGAAGGLADAASLGRLGRRAGKAGAEPGALERPDGLCPAGAGPSPTDGFWGTADWLLCRDERWRPAQSSVQRVADGLPGGVVPSGAFVPASYPLAPSHKDARRVMRLRGYGNAIVPQAAAEFIAASREVLIETGIWDALRRTHALREAAA